jgi:hypothetical protein
MSQETAEAPAGTALVVRPGIPERMIALKAETLAEIRATHDLLAGVETVADAVAVEAVSTVLADAARLDRDIQKQRLELTRPIDAAKKAIKAAVDEALAPLEREKSRVAGLVATTTRRLEKERQEAMRKAREEAEEKARKERARLEAERQAEIERQQEEAALFGGEPEPEPPPVVVVPVVEDVPELPKVKSAVQTRQLKRLVIDDESAIPREIQGVRLLEPSEKAIRKLLDAGIPVPGCRLETYNSTAVRGG